ncbi:MAG TPA: hypothetical protein VJ203_10870 [Bacteroidales bacterium]|nr:hypothetical protein [Bacteroidales bacterium]
MQQFNKYSLVIVIILVIGIAVLSRTLGHGHFRNDASKWAEPSITQSNLLPHRMLNNLTGNTLMVDLGDRGDLLIDRAGSVNIPAGSVLGKDNLKKLRDHDGNIILASEDAALTAKIWMMLSQMGFDNLYILSSEENNEVFNYEFLPDTVTK